MDETDYKIIDFLREDSRETNMEIARKLNVSEGTIRKRIMNLVNSGIIRKFTIETSLSIEGIVLIELDSRQASNTLKTLKSLYSDIYEFSGSIDVAVRISKNTIEELNMEVDKIRDLKGVVNTDTMVRLK
ncbi:MULTISPECIES: winged helix-turn-helix transcriptional regulator [Ferroplasma]|jgi:Lrp/AsnC family transcriptional regulator of lysine biosynthesis|uniref:AsnC family transcriptional regulator n=2 Tax=Ferroplasma TaxID=74968 RepID=S0APB0_FERAC|nr:MULTISPECIES: winged helix-turn-helix transcriptional regulator [Ferroplasma]MCL4349687.1 winged helix-turn-helix transcriptional regulator [Candidatus Thermoplasmatota archaeon]AGO60607.1 AsnC family transcriptional regulator [Ferroplasma acidarmanus Fer1]ARD85369.1 AsnC family transcriptional regulator [Ferroplasma acidiphilum]NOL61046.1 winged helix-turn-helix transcriptional regulator [Ferroplasma acidiphilum]WMT52477.1 MAG: winged helix-turn-helix transcriptional regulator [Ferroplasma